MKTNYIFAIVLIGAAIAFIISMTGNASTYVSFGEAKELSEKGFKKSIHVVGTLPKTKRGQITGIAQSPDKLTFTFQLLDQEGYQQEVFYASPMPTDFDKSEQVVIIGAYAGDHFVAEKILLKCPSKYQEEPAFTS